MSRRLVWAFTAFGGLSLAAVATGVLVAHAQGVSGSVWARNLASWAVGALAALLLGRFAGPRVALAFCAAAPIGLLGALANTGRLGVHRWLDLGPLHINAAEVLLPPAIAACAALGRGRLWPWFAAAAMALLVVQPDASQATAFGGALAVLLGVSRLPRALRIAGVVAVGMAVGASWLRRDPLAPVPEVEEIMRLAWTVSPLAAIAAWTALLGAAASFWLFPAARSRAGAWALGVYAILSALTPLMGAFPVPLVGMAMSPIVGLWLGAGMMAAQARRGAQCV